MCGIVGIAGPGPVTEAEMLRMCEAIRHRGPDDWGTFVEGGVGLGMRRLSIIDLAGGHQPIANEDDSVRGRLNGEIYNHEALRQRAGRAGPSVPDPHATPRSWSICTRTMASGCSSGCGACSASRIWDRRRRRLMLARDHFGQKPLFYTERGGRLAFASEIKALLARDPSLATLSPFALDQYLTLRFVQAPETFFERIRALPPAHFLIWENGATRVERYWDLAYGPKWDYSEAETLERIDALLAETVAMHLTSDVPVGAFLSGGLDSTLIAAYASKVLGPELRTFSMGIPYRNLNELPAAAAVAKLLRHPALRRGGHAVGGRGPAPAGRRRSTSRRTRSRSACSTWPG